MSLISQLKNTDFVPFNIPITYTGFALDLEAKAMQVAVANGEQAANFMSDHGRDIFFVGYQYALLSTVKNIALKNDNPHITNAVTAGLIFLVYSGYECIQHLATLPQLEFLSRLAEAALVPNKLDTNDILMYGIGIAGAVGLSYAGALVNRGIKNAVKYIRK